MPLEGGDSDAFAWSAQEAEAASNHLDWRCSHTHIGSDEAVLGPATCPHRHVPTVQQVFDIDADLLAGQPVRWVTEWAGPNIRCRGIEVTRRDGLERPVADAGNPQGHDPVAARLLAWVRPPGDHPG